MTSKNQNCLSDLHGVFTRTPAFFRERMCEECNWSTPIFYRKMRLINDWDKDSRGTAALSNAEKAMMKKVAAEIKAWFQSRIVQLIES
jgi:hypothetical protein